jgi:hypothetical protein
VPASTFAWLRIPRGFLDGKRLFVPSPPGGSARQGVLRSGEGMPGEEVERGKHTGATALSLNFLSTSTTRRAADTEVHCSVTDYGLRWTRQRVSSYGESWP